MPSIRLGVALALDPFRGNGSAESRTFACRYPNEVDSPNAYV